MKLKSILHLEPLIEPPGAGLYHYREQTGPGDTRLHLRIDPDGSGFLMVNASRVYHFNPTAAFMTYLVLEKTTPRQAIKSIVHAYDISRAQASKDFNSLAGQIHLMITPAFEQLSGLIRDFSNFSAADVAFMKSTEKLVGDFEYTQQLRTLQAGEDDNLVALIPVIANLPPQTRGKLIHHFQTCQNVRLSKLVMAVDELDPASVEILQEITQLPPEMESIEPIFDTILPFSKTDLSAPYRMDLALTYRCNNACHHCYNPAYRQRDELDTAAWTAVIDELWRAGVPHIIFTGGEPTLREDLPQLIAHAEANGQITGINTNGRRLKDPQYVQQLVDAGLDHIQITLESHDPLIHDKMVGHPGAWQETTAGIRNALATRLYVMTNTTLLTNNYQSLRDTLQFLADLGVKRVGLNALIYSGQGQTVGTGLQEEMLPDLLVFAREMVDENHQKLIWYTPTQYCHFDPVKFDFETLGVKGCTAALYNMCIEPDGKVLPCQSYYQPVGQILKQPWSEIWNHDLAVSLRNRTHVPQTCKDCSLLAICGGGCPLAARAGKIETPRAIHFVDA